MFLLDDQNKIVDAECSLDLFEGFPCVVVESSGGANPARGVKRRNPDYNKLLNLIFRRLALSGTKITKVVLDSAKVSDIPVEQRIAKLDRAYPVDLSAIDIEGFRKSLQREIAAMHQDPSANAGGNSQKRIRICLSKAISPDLLLTKSADRVLAEQLSEHAPGLSGTEKEYLRTARIGQGRFRKHLLKAYEGTCPVTGIQNLDLLVASHIKPWNACTNAERLDPQNGVLLSALFDRLFDRGLITFGEDGVIIVSPVLSSADCKKCGLEHARTIKLSERSRQYMRYHRAMEFRNT